MVTQVHHHQRRDFRRDMNHEVPRFLVSLLGWLGGKWVVLLSKWVDRRVSG